MKELPFAVVDDEDFRTLLEMCNPAVTPLLIGSDALGDAVRRRFQETKQVIKAVLQQADAITITCDGWTSPDRIPMLGIMAHWIDSRFEMQEVILSLKEIEGDHSGAALAAHLIPVLEDFGLANKLFCVVADNASPNGTMADAIEKACPGFRRQEHLLGCVAHVINLVARDGLKAFSKKLGEDGPVPHDFNVLCEPITSCDINSVLTRLQKMITWIYKSPQRVQSFLKQVEADLGEPLQLIRNVDTQWNSDLACYRRAYQLRASIDTKCRNDPDYRPYTLSNDEWDLVGHLVTFLEPLEQATKDLSASKYPSLGDVVPVYEWILKKLDSVCSFPFFLATSADLIFSM